MLCSASSPYQKKALDAMTTDVNFAADACNPFSVPESEPFYIVEFGYGYAYRVYMTRTGEVLWNVLLRYDGSNMDAEPAEKMFDQVLCLDVTLADLWRERCGELGMTEWFCNVNGDYYYIDPWRKRLPSPKCGFSLKKYEAEHPYCHEEGSGIGEWTRNINGLPDEKVISQDAAVNIALQVILESLGEQLSARDVHVFYDVTHPEKPEWRIANATCYVTLDAYTGEVLLVEKSSDEGSYRTIGDFLSK